jgi:hypothetical protein
MNVPFRQTLDAPSRHGFTGEDVLRMQEAGLLLEGGKFELIDGEIIDMPSEGALHLALKEELNRFLVRNLPDDLRVLPDGTLRLSDADWPEPDFYMHHKATPPGSVRGADTLLVIELSDSTLAHDLGLKADLYRSHGVREYWVVDVNAGVLHVHRADGAWPAAAIPLTEAIEPRLVPGLRIRIADFLPD